MTHDPSVPRSLVLLALAATVALLASAAPITADAAMGSPALGRSTYRSYCASCHGAGGTGDGTLADSLDPRPSDLTHLAERNDGVYPAELVRQSIDGRTPVKGHVKSEMPVWGTVFETADPQSDEASVARKIEDLVAYLATIQAKPQP